MRSQSFYLYLVLLFLSACSVLQPVHESNAPETLGPWGFRIGAIAGSSPTVSSNLNTTDNSSYSLPLEGFRVDIGLGRSFEFDYDAFVGGAVAAGSSYQLRWQIFGNPLFETKAGDSALTLGVRNSVGTAPGFTSSDITNASYYSADLSLNSYDVSLVYGHRMYEAFGAYIGAKNISGSVTASYHSVVNGPVVATTNKSFTAYGGVAGLYLSPHGKSAGVDLILELDYMNVPATYSTASNWVSDVNVSLGIPFHF